MFLSHLLSANNSMEVLIVDGHKVTRSEQSDILQSTVTFWCSLYIIIVFSPQPAIFRHVFLGGVRPVGITHHDVSSPHQQLFFFRHLKKII